MSSVFTTIHRACQLTWIVVNKRGLFLTRLVKMNSNLLDLYLVITYRACVVPLIFEVTFLIARETIQSRPMPIEIRIQYIL